MSRPWGKPKAAFVCSFTTCKKSFSNRQELINHKANTKGHNYCLICDKDFTNPDSIRNHVAEMHPQSQNLPCPGCGKSYTRFAGLIGHWENNECPNQNFSAASIHEKREKSLTFAHRLRQQGLGENSSVRVIFRPEGVRSASQSPEPPIEPCRDPDANPTIFKPGDFPLLGTQQYKNGESKPPGLLTGFNTSITEAEEAWAEYSESGNSSKSGQSLFPDAKAPSKPEPEVLRELSTPSRNNPKTWSEHDPANPAFNVNTYWDEVLGWFKCPHGCGGKKHRYYKIDRFINHLQSAAHRDVKKIRCPACFRQFLSAHALAQHAESSSTKCVINTTRQYHHFVGELSAGLIKPVGHHLDTTLKYTTTERAKERAGVANVAGTAVEMYSSTRDARQEAAEKERREETCEGW